MIRYGLIHKEVLHIYQKQPTLVFPIEPCDLSSLFPNLRIMTYQQYAEWNDCSLERVVKTCKSKFGCTHYDPQNDRYLILWNEDTADNNVIGRQRWTKAHELGHVVLKHLPMTAAKRMSRDGFYSKHDDELEYEADLFAALLLCPWALYRQLYIDSPADMVNIFGLSETAANVRWEDYNRWRYCKRAPEELQWADRMQSVCRLKERAKQLKHPPFRYKGFRRSGIDVYKTLMEDALF